MAAVQVAVSTNHLDKLRSFENIPGNKIMENITQ
jgi:hypothetical protein